MKIRIFPFAYFACILLATGCGFYDRTQVVTRDGQTNVTYSPKPALTEALGTATGLAKFLPAPWNELLTGALAITTGLVGFVAKRKSTIVRALVIGVEAANHPPVKAAIQQIASAAGVERGLNRVVRRVTKTRVKPKPTT
jgi:hypothetical protein